jgi:transposase
MVNYIIRVSYPAANADTFDRLNVELAKFNVAGAIKRTTARATTCRKASTATAGTRPSTKCATPCSASPAPSRPSRKCW